MRTKFRCPYCKYVAWVGNQEEFYKFLAHVKRHGNGSKGVVDKIRREFISQ
jgi:hypothetical protein